MRTWIVALGMVAMTAGLLSVPASDVWAASKRTQANAGKATKPHAPRAKRARGSGSETTAERDRRLSRECKGLPNAGACLGYAN